VITVSNVIYTTHQNNIMINSFLIKGKKVVFRYPKRYDLEGIWKFYNKAIRESIEAWGNLSRHTKVTLKEEGKWLRTAIERTRNKESIYLLVEAEGEIVGSSSIDIGLEESGKHVGFFGITLLESFTGIGIGTRLTKYIIEKAKENLKTEIVRLNVFSNNIRAYKMYRSLGFQEVGRIKKGMKIKGKYADDIIMVKYL